MKRLSILLMVVLGLGLYAVTVCAHDGSERPRRQLELKEVRKIYVGDMGRADEAERFRFLLEEALAKKGFTIVGSREEADAILSGALSVRVQDDSTQARAFVKLETQTGHRLWARDFGHRILVNPFDRKEPTKRRAAEVAKELREEWERAGK
jgi:hypothetical protein